MSEKNKESVKEVVVEDNSKLEKMRRLTLKNLKATRELITSQLQLIEEQIRIIEEE